MESTKFKERCKQHPNFKLEFMKINNSESTKSNPFFCCLNCIRKERIDFKDYISIKCIIQHGLDEVFTQWPPVNNPDLLDKLVKILEQNTTTDKLVETVTQFFAELKKSINDSIDACQKKMMKIAEEIPCTGQNILKQYQEISKMHELRSHLLNNNIDIEKKENLCSELVKLQQQQSQNNTEIFQTLISQNIPKFTLNLEKPLLLQQSILKSIDSINLFQKNTQNVDVDFIIGNYDNGQNHINLYRKTNNQPVVEMIHQSQNQMKNTASSIILDKNRNYVFKLKLDIQQNGHNLFVGLMQDQYLHTKIGFAEYLCCYFQKNNGKISFTSDSSYGINEILKGDQFMLSEENEIEMRININQKILHILDHPQKKWKIGLTNKFQDKLINSTNLRLYIGTFYQSKVTLIESKIVESFE